METTLSLGTRLVVQRRGCDCPSLVVDIHNMKPPTFMKTPWISNRDFCKDTRLMLWMDMK